MMAVLAGCGPTSYADAVGVQTTPIRGRYVVEATGNGRTGMGLLTGYIERKAAELCALGYNIEGRGNSATTNYSRIGNGAYASTSNDIVVIVTCKPKDADPVEGPQEYPDDTPVP